MKKNKAITLIALIITIIVLLILAGVSITMLSGDNGILNKAKTAKENSDSAGATEENKLSKVNDTMDILTTNRSASTAGFGDETTLWEGNVYTTGAAMTLSDSIENYKYIEIENKWGGAIQINWVKVSNVVKSGYYTSPSNIYSHILISPFDNYYAYMTFTSSKTAAIAETNGSVYIQGIYGVK